MHRQTTRRLTSPIPAALCLLLLPAVGSAAGESGVKFDRDADFANYKTYGWGARTKKPEGSPMAEGGAADAEIRAAIDRQLRARGYPPAADGKPDFLVSFDGAMESVTDFEGLRENLTGGIAWVMEGEINSYRRGTLMINVSDAGSGKTVWSAWTTEKVKDPGNPGKQIDKAVKKLLRRFPPR